MASQCLERAAAVVESSLRSRETDSTDGKRDRAETNGSVGSNLTGDEPKPTEQNWADVPPLSAIRSIGQQSSHDAVGDNEVHFILVRY